MMRQAQEKHRSQRSIERYTRSDITTGRRALHRYYSRRDVRLRIRDAATESTNSVDGGLRKFYFFVAQ